MMRKLEEIITEAFQQWDGERVSEPAQEALRELAKDGRFDEMTLLLNACEERYGKGGMSYVITYLPGLLLSNFIYGKAEAPAPIVEEYWRVEDAATTIREAALKPEGLSQVVDQIVRDIREMAKRDVVSPGQAYSAKQL